MPAFKIRYKICLVASSGGHLYPLYLLKSYWKKHHRFWVTFDKIDAISLLKNETIYKAHFPTNRNFINLIKNTLLAFRILMKEKPDVVLSSGAGVAIPFFYLAKCFGAKTVFIEVYDRIDSPTLTGRVVYPVTDLFITQWAEQKKFYPKSYLLEPLL
jgi:UDP-N-acetylglucosamine:LPS N-acetylglucosamine transferase